MQKEFQSKAGNRFKVLVIGDSGAGKTSLIQCYVNKVFNGNYKATIGADFSSKVIQWDTNTRVTLQLWDIAGQDRFTEMTRVYYKDAVGCFIVFDVSKRASFESVIKWKNDLDSKVSLPDGSNVPCVLLANKCDLEKDSFSDFNREMNEFSMKTGFVGWFETSAVDGKNIEQAARYLVSKILGKEDSIKQEEERLLAEKVHLTDSNIKKSKCC